MAGIFINKVKTNFTNGVTDGCISKPGSNYDLGIKATLDYGPTYQTDFWNGVSVPAGSLVSYQRKSVDVQGPSIYIAPNTTDFVNYANNMNLGQTFTTAEQALAYIGRTDNIFVTNITYPDITTSGLNVLLDAGFTASYPWSEIHWYNVARGNNPGPVLEGTLTTRVSWFPNGTDFAGSYLVFNRNNAEDKVSFANNGYSTFTVDIWVNLGNIDFASGRVNIFSQVLNQTGGTAYNDCNFYIKIDSGTGYVVGGFKNGGNDFTVTLDTSPNPGFGGWVNYTLVYEGSGQQLIGYKNGSQVNASVPNSTPVSNGQPIIIGGTTTNTAGGPTNTYFDGYVGVARIYDLALDAGSIYNDYTKYVVRY